MARLQVGEMIPPFALPTRGGQVRTGDFKQRRNLVLVFQPKDCPGCVALLDALAVSYPAYRELEAQVVVVRRREPPAALSERLPFPVAWDEAGDVFEAFAGRDEKGKSRPTVYVTDRFGEVAFIRDGAGPEVAEEVLATLEFVEKACPECNTVAWGWDEVAKESGSRA